MKIERIRIENLYKAYSYDIDLKPDRNVFIMTGPNGYGKTTILNIIHNLSEGNLLFFHLLVFDVIEIFFERDMRLVIVQQELEVPVNMDEEIGAEQRKQTKFSFYNIEDREIASYYLNYELIAKVTRGSNIKPSTKRPPYRLKRTFADQMEEAVEATPMFYMKVAEEIGQNSFLMMLKPIESIYVPAERLVKRKEDEYNTIADVVRQLGMRIRRVYRDYLEKSQRFNSEMVDILIDDDVRPYTEKEYEDIYKILEEKISRLEQYGFGRNLNLRAYDEKKAQIQTVHIDTLRKKIDILEDFITKLEVFSNCLNSKDFAHKYIKFSPNQGMRFISKADGAEIGPERLSSGEKNEIILLYDMIFMTGRNSIVLIDEPENSLHVAWQREFIDDVEMISKANHSQVLIATHAPAIIGEHWNRTFDLYERNLR